MCLTVHFGLLVCLFVGFSPRDATIGWLTSSPSLIAFCSSGPTGGTRTRCSRPTAPGTPSRSGISMRRSASRPGCATSGTARIALTARPSRGRVSGRKRSESTRANGGGRGKERPARPDRQTGTGGSVVRGLLDPFPVMCGCSRVRTKSNNLLAKSKTLLSKCDITIRVGVYVCVCVCVHEV